MKFLNILFFSFMGTGCMFSQQLGNYIPLEFDNLTPLWTHTTFDSTIVGHEIQDKRDISAGFDGYSHIVKDGHSLLEPLIIKDDFLYNITNTLYDGDISGAIIEKINLNTGELVWKSVFDLRTGSYREAVQEVFLEKDTLVLYNLNILSEDPSIALPMIMWGAEDFVGIIKIRKYDIHTGNLLSEKAADENDPKVKALKPIGFGHTQLTQLSDNSLEHLQTELLGFENGNCLIFDTINTNGQLLNSSDTLCTGWDVDWIHSYINEAFKFRRSQNGTLYWWSHFSPDAKADKKLRAFLMIQKGKDISWISLEDQIDMTRYSYTQLWKAEDDYLVLKLGYKDEIKEDTEDMAILDNDGKVIKFIENIDQRVITHFPINLDEDFNFVGGSKYGGKVDGKNVFELYHLKGNELELLMKPIISHPDYWVLPENIIKLPNGDYLIQTIHREETENGYSRGRFLTTMRVTPESIGIETSSTEAEIEEDFFKVYPNPASDYIMVENTSQQAFSIGIYDMLGKEIFTKKANFSKDRISLNGITSGIYILKYIQNGKLIGTEKLIIQN